MEIDQSQVEIRVAAALSGDPDMLEIINSGKDFHSATAELIYGPNFTDEQRTASKTCIAEGQLVLTDTGLKPIESVRSHDLVWDGMEWVHHDGVVFQGERDVIEYAGLTATPDHMVFTAEGGALPFGAAASRLAGRRLAVGGNGGVPAWYTYPHGTQSCSQMVRGRHSSGWGGIRCGDGCVRRRARVYDIANAGPRSRFTVSGYIVSNCNFSLVYEIPENIGYMLSKSLSAATKKNVTREDAQRIADMIFGRYKRLREWMSERHKAGMAQGGAFTKWRGMDARFRPLPNLGLPYSGGRNDPNKPLVETAIRSTWNMPVQGTAADLTTAALSPIVRWIQDSNAQARLLVTIHDSVVGIVHESTLAEYISVATQAMTAHAGWLGVKLNADVKTGKRLGQMQKYKVD